jgi:hypothetical protein
MDESLHKTCSVCTGGGYRGVEEVGKRGQVGVVVDWFSNSPETHRRDLEKQHAAYMT